MNPVIIEKSLERFYATKSPHLPVEHHILFQHYPINKEAQRPEIERICKRFNIELHDAGRNLGLHEGFNFLFKRLQPNDDEVIIGYDPDSWPIGEGWDLALVRTILGSGGEIVWSSLMNPRSKSDLEARGYDLGRVDGHIQVWKTKTAVTNSVCAFSYSWLNKVGFTEPRPFYGHFETEMFGKLKGKRWAFVTGWEERDQLRDLHDVEYVHYKWAHAHLNCWDGDFESWLLAGKPLTKQAPKKLP